MYSQYYPNQNKIPVSGLPQDWTAMEILQPPPQPNLPMKTNSQNLTYSSNTQLTDKMMKGLFSPQKTPTDSASGSNFRQSIGSTGAKIRYGEGSPSNQLGIPERYRSDVEFNFMLSQLLQQMIGESQNVRQLENQNFEKGIGGIGSGFGN